MDSRTGFTFVATFSLLGAIWSIAYSFEASGWKGTAVAVLGGFLAAVAVRSTVAAAGVAARSERR